MSSPIRMERLIDTTVTLVLCEGVHLGQDGKPDT
jgi:hypothetical protein